MQHPTIPSLSTIIIYVSVIGPGPTLGGGMTTATNVSFPSMAILSSLMLKLVHCREMLEATGKETWLVSASKSSDSTQVYMGVAE